MNMDIIENIKKNVTLSELKNLKDIVNTPELKIWKEVFIEKKTKNEIEIFECLMNQIAYMLKTPVNMLLFQKNKRVFLEYAFVDEVPGVQSVVTFFEQLFEKQPV